MRILNLTISTFKLSRKFHIVLATIIALSVLFLLYGTSKRKVAAQGNARKKIDHRENAPKPVRTSQSMYAPITAMEQSSGSELALNNNGPISIVVNPVFYGRDGQAYAAQPITLEPTAVRHVNLDNIRPFALRGRNPSGGMALNYNGAMMEVVAQITSFGQGQAGSVDIPFSATMDYQSTTQEAVWWSPEQSTATIILGNASDTAITATLQFPTGEAATYYLAPYATESVVRRRNGRQTVAADSVNITTTGAVGSLRVTGAIQTNNNRYTSTIRFYDPQTTQQQNLYATNFRLKGNVPHLVLKNIGDAPLTATPRFLSFAGVADSPVQLAPVALAPSETAEVNLSQLLTLAASRQELEAVTVQILSSGAKGNLIGALSAHNEITRITFDAPLRDSGPIRNSTGGYPWQITTDYGALVSITNVGESPAKFAASVNFAGGTWRPAIKQLAVGETALFDLRKIRDEQLKDKDGNVIPATITTGQFHWSRFQGDDNLKLMGRLEIVGNTDLVNSLTAEATPDAGRALNRRRRANRNVSSSFSCGVCCPDSGLFPYMQASSLGVLVNDFRNVESRGDLVTCYGGTSYTAEIVSHNWAVTDPCISLAVTEGYSNAVTGVSTGFAYFYAIAETYFVWEEGAGDCYRSTFVDPEILGDASVASLIINKDGQDVTGTTLNVIVGQKMNLQAVLTAPSSLGSSQTSWTIPGFRLANYVDDQNNAVITPLNNLTNNNTIVYYWLDAGDSRVVKFDVSFPSSLDPPASAVTKSVTFNVKRPTAQVTAVTTSPQIITAVSPPLLAFRTISTPGISFTRTVTMPPSFPGGELKWVQKISSTLSRRKSFPGNNWQKIEAMNVLDNTNPYDPGISVSDSPAVELLPGFSEFTVNENFEMYLMFKPAGNGSIWVPLRRVLWYWNVGATRNAITGNWSLAANPTYSNNPASEDVITPPQWVGNIQSFNNWLPE